MMRHVHHVWWRSKGGPTDIDYLVGVCAFDHTAIHKKHLYVTALGGQQFAWRLPEDRPVTAASAIPLVHGTLEDRNAAAGVHCDAGTCASSGENEPFNLRYVVDTIFDNIPAG